jgi:hypothetical protein
VLKKIKELICIRNQAHNLTKWSQDIVHHPHEIGWSIFQAKGHDQPFKKTIL